METKNALSARDKRWPRLDLIFIGGLTLMAFALRVYRLGTPSLWYDELLELDIAQGPLSQIWPQLERHAATPLDYYLLHGWLQLGQQEAWVRFPALVFGALAVPVIYALGRRLFNRRVGGVAATLLSGSSFSISYSQEARPYALLLLLVMISFLGLWQVYKTHNKKYWRLTILGLVGATLTHYFALFMLLPMGLFVVVQQVRRPREKTFWRHTAYFGLCLLVLLALFTFAGRLRHLYNVGSRFATVVSQPETLTLPPEEKPNRGSGPPTEANFLVENVLAPLSTVDEPTLLLYSVFFLVAVGSIWRQSDKNRAAVLLLLGWLILPILSIYLFLLQRGTFYAARYILYTLPAYLILVAYGLDTLVTTLLKFGAMLRAPTHPLAPGRILPSSLLFLALLSLLLAELDENLTYYSTESREDWRAVGQLLARNAQPDDAVIAVRAEPALNWYYPPARAPFGTYGRSDPIWQALQAHERRWFVLSSYSQKQDQGLRTWLREQNAVLIAIDQRVIVYFQEEGLANDELLAQVKTFSLPPKAFTYALLADQFLRAGDLKAGRTFYHTAVELAADEAQKAEYQARLASLGLSRK